MDTKNLKKLRIYIVDDHKLFREGLKLLLSTQDFVHHIYEASNGRDFIENLSFVDCDLVLMDIEMPEMNGIEATEQALRIRPDGNTKLTVFMAELPWSMGNNMMNHSLSILVLHYTGQNAFLQQNA